MTNKAQVVVGKGFVRGNAYAQVGCVHKRFATQGGCGGCYARLFFMIEDALKADDPKALLTTALEALAEDNRGWDKRKKRK